MKKQEVTEDSSIRSKAIINLFSVRFRVDRSHNLIYYGYAQNHFIGNDHEYEIIYMCS